MKETTRLMKDVILVGCAFMVHFTATLGATHLQSSINTAGGVGTAALAAQYAALVVSSLFLSVFLIQHVGCKWTMVIAILCYIPYMVAQLYPKMYTLVPTALLMGLAAAPLWSAKCTYLCVIAEMYTAATDKGLQSVREKVIGSFFMIFLFSMVWGNLISSLVLSTGESGDKNMTISTAVLQCGADYCPASTAVNSNPNLERPDEEKITLIMGIYIGCIVLAALIVVFGVEKHDRYQQEGILSQVTATLRLHSDRKMLLMLPLSVWLGIDYAFVEAEYSAAFVACAWGISQIGFVIVVYGLCNSGGALITGWMLEKVGSALLLYIIAVLHIIVLAATLAWNPAKTHPVLYFIVAGLLGAADGQWAVQINSLYAVLFPGKEDAAYSNFRLWQSIGFVIAFSYSHYVCTAVKIYIVIALLIVAVAGFIVMDVTILRKKIIASK